MSYSLKETIQLDPSLASAFGTLETNEMTPLIQLDFVYGVNTQTGTTAASGTGATADTNGSRLRLQSGTGAAGTASFTSRRIAKYRPGQGITARFTAAFTTGVASSTQIVGVGNATDGYFFGYNGTTFGILHRVNGSDSVSPAAWTAQANWNGDKADGTGASAFNWDKTKGNVCMIKYPYLGYGDIQFFVEDSTSGRFILVHTIRYANTTATVQLTNPNMPFYAQSVNTGATTNQTIYVASVGIFLSGVRSYISSPKWAMNNNKSTVTTETNILTIRNATTYNGVTNRSLIRINSVSVGSSAANGVVTVRLKIGATLGGSPSYTTINGTTADSGVTITSGNSIASYDTAGTTVASGTYIFGFSVDNPDSAFIDLLPYEIFIAPTETLTISVESTVSTTASIAINWSEDI
jgi:hypothetical protein